MAERERRRAQRAKCGRAEAWNVPIKHGWKEPECFKVLCNLIYQLSRCSQTSSHITKINVKPSVGVQPETCVRSLRICSTMENWKIIAECKWKQLGAFRARVPTLCFDCASVLFAFHWYEQPAQFAVTLAYSYANPRTESRLYYAGTCSYGLLYNQYHGLCLPYPYLMWFGVFFWGI